MVKAQANTSTAKVKAPRVKVPAHKSKLTTNRENITNTVVGILRADKVEGKKLPFGKLSVFNTDTQKFSTDKSVKLVYGKDATTLKRITEVITYTTYKRGIESEYSYKYVIAKDDYTKQKIAQAKAQAKAKASTK